VFGKSATSGSAIAAGEAEARGMVRTGSPGTLSVSGCLRLGPSLVCVASPQCRMQFGYCSTSKSTTTTSSS